MEGTKQPFFKKRPNQQFKRKGGNKKGKWDNSGREQSFGNSNASETVYRILCHSRKIGSVIGKGGSIIKALREETKAKITVADSVPGSDERVIIIFSSSNKINEKDNSDEGQDPATGKENEPLELHCPAQDALLKVHDRIIEEDIVEGMENEDDSKNAVTARLLVPNNVVGCLLGRKGDVIQRLRSDTGASIRVLPAEHLPSCAMSTDELVQISGKPAVAKRALFEVSTLLHQNPRKDKPPLNFPVSYSGQGFHPPGPPMANMPPPGNPMWSPPYSNSRDRPPMPWMRGYGNQPSGFGMGGFDGGPPMHEDEAPREFSMKILCSVGKIGGVIGKGGFNVKQLQQETGASIQVKEASAEVEERVICVSSFEAMRHPSSQTIEAILQLQDKTSEFSEKGIITTRLLVPSSKVGCILGQGGHIINEMRRRTQADIRVYSKEDKPKCAADDEELVQISGNFGVAKDALAEIASRLRARCLRDANAGAEPVPVGPVKGFGSAGSLPGAGPRHSGPMRAGSSGGYELGGGREYEPSGYPVPPRATGYPRISSSSMDGKMPYNSVGPVHGRKGTNMSEVPGTRLKLQDPQSGGSECVVEIHGSSANILQSYMSSSGQNINPPRSSYQDYNNQQSTYPNMNNPQNPYQNMNTPQTPPNPYHNINAPYLDMNAQSAPYQHPVAQQAPYHNANAQQAPYHNANAQQAQYQHLNTQQATYQNINAQQAPYQNVGAHSSYHY